MVSLYRDEYNCTIRINSSWASARKDVMDKKYLLEVRRQAVELCIFDGIMLTPENIINALSELGYIVARPTKRAADSPKAGAKSAVRRVRKSKVIRPAKSG